MTAEPSREEIEARLEYLRAELRAERISWGELAELQALTDHIDAGDVELLEAAGVPEEALPYPYDVAETVDGEWMVLRGGFQIGDGPHDKSGASDTTFATRSEAVAYALSDSETVLPL